MQLLSSINRNANPNTIHLLESCLKKTITNYSNLEEERKEYITDHFYSNSSLSFQKPVSKEQNQLEYENAIYNLTSNLNTAFINSQIAKDLVFEPAFKILANRLITTLINIYLVPEFDAIFNSPIDKKKFPEIYNALIIKAIARIKVFKKEVNIIITRLFKNIIHTSLYDFTSNQDPEIISAISEIHISELVMAYESTAIYILGSLRETFKIPYFKERTNRQKIKFFKPEQILKDKETYNKTIGEALRTMDLS